MSAHNENVVRTQFGFRYRKEYGNRVRHQLVELWKQGLSNSQIAQKMTERGEFKPCGNPMTSAFVSSQLNQVAAARAKQSRKLRLEGQTRPPATDTVHFTVDKTLDSEWSRSTRAGDFVITEPAKLEAKKTRIKNDMYKGLLYSFTYDIIRAMTDGSFNAEERVAVGKHLAHEVLRTLKK